MNIIKSVTSFLTGFILTSVLTSGCSTGPKLSTDVPVTGEEKQYLVRERYPNPAPEWARDFAKYRLDHKGQERVFLGESGDVSDRVAGCDLAALEAKKKISSQIATLISEKIASTKAGGLVIDRDHPNDQDLKRHFEATIAAKSMAFLVGVQEVGTYWEERDYSQTGGHKRVYLCSSVLSLSDRDYEAAVRRTAKSTADSVDDPEAKAVVKEALKGIDESFKSFTGR